MTKAERAELLGYGPAFDARHRAVAAKAFARLGKGRHPARSTTVTV